jgi:hypothetical protein
MDTFLSNVWATPKVHHAKLLSYILTTHPRLSSILPNVNSSEAPALSILACCVYHDLFEIVDSTSSVVLQNLPQRMAEALPGAML